MSIETFTETVNPDNRFNFLKEESCQELIIGADCTHTFEFDFICSDVIASFEILYKQGLETTFTFLSSSINVIITENRIANKSYISLKLTPDETSRFRKTNLDTFVQIKFITKTGAVFFDNKQKVIIKEPIKQQLLN